MINVVGPLRALGVTRVVGPLRKFIRNRIAVGCLIALMLFLLLAIVGPQLYPIDPLNPGGRPLVPPSLTTLGTDNLGRDMLALFMSGARVSFMVGFFAVGATLAIGITVGGIAGYVGGAVDAVLMRTTDLFLVLPNLLLAIVLVAIFGPNLVTVIVAISLVTWPRTARLLRAEVLTIREREYVEAARTIGKGNFAIIFDEILPNALTPVIVNASFEVGNVIIIEAALSFLGLSDPSRLSWGYMIRNGTSFLLIDPWLAILPGIGLSIVVLSLNVLGDALEEVLNPHSR